MEDSMNFIERTTKMISRFPNISSFLADLLNNIRKDCESEFVYPKLTESLKFITERYNSYYIYNFKVSEDQMKLLCSALCLSGKEEFLNRFDEVATLILLRIREKVYSNDSLSVLNELLSTYYNRYPDAWATLLDRSETIFKQIFPNGRKNVLGCDEDVMGVVRVLETVTKKLPRFCYNEIIKKLIRQCDQAQNQGNIDNFPWDRANIVLQTFLYLCSVNSSPSSQSYPSCTVWKSEFSKGKIGDLEFEPMSKEISELIKTILMKICKQFWQSHLNEFVFDTNKTKLLKFIEMVLEKFTQLVEGEIILKLMESNVTEIKEKAKEVYLRDGSDCCDKSGELIHKIGNMIFGQAFKIPNRRNKDDFDENDMKVYSFFEESFNWECKEIPSPPEGLQENQVLRGGIFYILESLSSWKLIDPTSSGKLDKKEIELFGKVVEVYFKLLTKYESLVKTVYLEKQNDKNIILRSWSSLVGFKRNSKEIADFLVSILDYSDDLLRWRIIESFKCLPLNRLSEFMKLFERFRLTVSEDFVNLKRSRRSEKCKIEITRVYKNVLISWKSQQDLITNLTPLRMILRHVIELYYYVSKNEIVDEFIWILRGEFCSLLKEYLRIINLMNFNTKKSFLPLKFHLEVWLTVDEWQNGIVDDYIEDIEGLFVNFSYNLISAVAEIDKTTLPTFIDNLIIKISRISTNEELKSVYVYNLLKSSMTDDDAAQLIFIKMVEWIGAGRDGGRRFQEGILLVLKERQEKLVDGPAMELFKLMCDDEDEAEITDPNGVLEMFYLVSDAKLQRKILKKLKFNAFFVLDEKLIKSLFEMSVKLVETFPNTLKGLWQSIANSDKAKAVIVHFLVDTLQKTDIHEEVVVFVYKAIEDIDSETVLRLLLRYAHPYAGTRKIYTFTPLEAVLKIIDKTGQENNTISVIKVLFMNKQTEKPLDCYELMKWALECPVNKISSSAWRELKKWSLSAESNEFANELLSTEFKNELLSAEFTNQLLSAEFASLLLSGTKRFLQHLVCPGSLKYFDPVLVKEILEFYEFLVLNCENNFKLIEEILEFAIVQLSAEDEIVFESTCELIRTCLKRNENLEVKLVLYEELAKKPFNSIDLMFELMKIDQKLSIEKFFCNLFTFLPYLFRLFEESLNLQQSQLQVIKDVEYSAAEMEFLHLLIKTNQKIIIEEAEVDENGNLCLLELGEFLISIEKQKKRSKIDFYKTLATILAALNKFTLKLVKSVEEEGFLVFYFDALRVLNVDFDENLAFGIADKLASGEDDDCPIRQRVIDYLILKS